MKRHISLIFILILLCGIMGCGETVLPSRNFKATKLASGTNENLNDIWYNYGKFCVVGDNGVILGSTESATEWTAQISPTNVNLYDITGRGAIYYAVGKNFENENYIIKYDGSIWSTLFSGSSVLDTLYGIDCDDWEDELVVVGAGGWGRYIDDRWQFEALTDYELRKVKSNGVSEQFFSFSAIGTDETGNNIIYRYTKNGDKTFINKGAPLINVKLNAFISEDRLDEDVYVGDLGTILLYNKTTQDWRQVPSGTTENLNGVAFMYFNSSDLELLIAGDYGTLLFYDGTSCSKVNSGTTANLNAVCTELLSYYVVGDNGTILHVKW